MAHEIHTTDRFGYVGKKAWHGIGQELPEGLTAEEGFRRIGLDWPTFLAPVHADLPDGGTVELPKRRAHMRILEDGTPLELGLVHEGYKPMENIELARFADAVAGDNGLHVETAGSLYNSRRVFSLIRLPEPTVASADDIVEQYLLVSNGHGGTAAFLSYLTSVRVVCANTLRWSESDMSKGIRFRHQGDFQEKVAMARQVLEMCNTEADVFQRYVTALVGVQMTAEKLDNLFHAIADKYLGKIPAKGMVTEEKRAELMEKRAETIASWYANFENERQTLPGIQGSAWAAYNAVSEFHDHERGRSAQGSEARIASNLFGASHRDKNVAFKETLALVK